MKESAIHALSLDQTHRAGVTVRKNGLRILLSDGSEAAGDRVQRFIPGNSFEVAAALRSNALHGKEQPVLVVRPFFVVRDFRAEAAMGKGMSGITLYPNGLSVFVNLHQHGARIRAVM